MGDRPPLKSKPGSSLLLDANAFHDWIIDAKPGDSRIYFVGELAVEIQCGNFEVREVAQIALRAQAARRICLTQRRLGVFRYEYVATKRKEPDAKKAHDKRLLGAA